MKPIIAIDAGHYNYTPGKRCMKSIDPKETRERFLNDRMALHVEDLLLKSYECDVIRVDDRTGETDIELHERANKANRAGATAFISIHHNAGINGGSGGGICVFRAENASETTKKFQKAVYDETVKRTGLKGNRATPLPVANHTVTYNTNMPSILGEFGFMDSKIDVPIILTDEFSQQCAQGIVDALVSVFKIKEKKMANEKTTEEVIYKDIKDVPASWRDNVQKLLDNDIINGGTDKSVNATDVNLSKTEAKMAHIFVKYVDKVLAPIAKDIKELKEFMGDFDDISEEDIVSLEGIIDGGFAEEVTNNVIKVIVEKLLDKEA